MADAYLCEARRTPIGRYGGSLACARADDLAAIPIKALMELAPKADWDAVDDVVLGCANQAGEDNRNVARMAALLAGLPVSVPGSTVNRLCGSGLDAVGSAARAIRSGDAEFIIAGGVESMTRAPFVTGKATEAFSRTPDSFDTTIGWRFINPEMRRSYGVDSMPETAENVAAEFSISREDQDIFALRSQIKCREANEAGFFASELTPVVTASRNGTVTRFEADEHPRPGTALENLSRLKPAFREGGTVTAGNSSGINDGAAALFVASEAAASRHGLTPHARIVAMKACGVPPRIMGIGPWPATERLLAHAGLTLAQIDLFEFNEAFAAQSLAVTRQLGLADDDPRVNPHGGAIAIGHPLGCSGARLALTAVNGLERRGGRYAVAAMCIGVGQGIAMLIERV